MRELTAVARLHVADPQLQMLVVLVRRVCELRAVRRPRRIGVERGVLRDVERLAAHRHDVDVADRGEGDLFSVGRNHRTDDAERLTRRRRREVALLARVRTRSAHDLHRRLEVDRGRVAAADRALPDFSVGDVEEFVRRGARDE